MIQAGHAILATLAGLPVLLAVLRRRGTFGHLAAIALFTLYLAGVANFTMLPLMFDPDYRDAFAEIGSVRSISLVPFFLASGDVMTQGQVLGNVLLGVPFGFGLPFVRRSSLRAVLLAGVLFAVSIETIQAVLNVLAIAFPTRSVDVNDVILNTLGAGIGLAALVLASGVYRTLFGGVTADLGAWAHFHRTLLRHRTGQATIAPG